MRFPVGKNSSKENTGKRDLREFLPRLCKVALIFCVGTSGIIAPLESNAADGSKVIVGSKSFTESTILGDIATLTIEDAGFDVEHKNALGDSATFQALVRGDIDLYPEYTGTMRQSLFTDRDVETDEQLRAVLAEYGLKMTSSLGFENAYAIGMLKPRAKELGINTISDFRKHPDVRFGFGESFLNRSDGWPALKQAYQLPQRDPRGMEHDLAYVALVAGDFDAMDVFTTDAQILRHDLRIIDDDLSFFPDYHAVFLYRAELEERSPAAVSALKNLEGAIAPDQMIALNSAVNVDQRSSPVVAAEFVREAFAIESSVERLSVPYKIWLRTVEHVTLVIIAMSLGILVAVPLGIIAYRFARLGQVVLYVVNILQTIPSLALLTLMVPYLGIGANSAIAALFLYSMLPIVRNTYIGFQGIDPAVREAATAMGFRQHQLLWQVELPLAAPAIFGGIKTSAVLSIGFATLGAFVGAGGYGEPILTGIRLQNTGMILQGAIPAACLAIIAENFFEFVEYRLVPQGLRDSTSRTK